MTTEQRLTFDAIASLYDECRPGYPEALFDELLHRAGICAGGQALEIGCGTGQATGALASRGLSVLALEPGGQLAELAEHNLARFPDVEVRREMFEDARLDAGTFDLVVAAQSFHWVPPEVSFSKAWRILRPGGALAVLGNAVSRDRAQASQEIDAAYATHAPTIAGPPVTRWYAAEGPLAGHIEAAEGFGAPHVSRFPWSERYSTARYCDLLRTHSDHQMLPPEQLAALLASVSAAIDAHGGTIEISYEANLYVAKRAA